MAADPPFSRIDLISCRNVLIYLDAALQKRVMPLLHYALNPDGFLFLGTSENIGAFTDLFDAVDAETASSPERGGERPAIDFNAAVAASGGPPADRPRATAAPLWTAARRAEGGRPRAPARATPPSAWWPTRR